MISQIDNFVSRGVLSLFVAAAMLFPISGVEAASQVSIDITVHEVFPVAGGKVVKSTLAACKTGTVKTSSTSRSDGAGLTTFKGSKRFDCGKGNTFTLSFTARSSGCRATDTGTWTLTKGTGAFVNATGQGKLVGTFTLGGGRGTFCNSDGVDDRYTGKLTY